MEEKGKAFIYKITIVSLGILLLGSFWLSLKMAAEPVNLVIRPAVPREGEPVLATFKLNNPTSQALLTNYQFYVEDRLVAEGATTIAPVSEKTYEYAYENPLKLGEQLNFRVNSQSEYGNYERIVSLPPYPPQIWSSFTSFASFSTSVMSSMSTMAYYRSTFGGDIGLNVGIIVSLVLICLLIFMELSHPVVENNPTLRNQAVTMLSRMRLRFSTVTWILLIISLGIVYTTVIAIITV